MTYDGEQLQSGDADELTAIGGDARAGVDVRSQLLGQLPC